MKFLIFILALVMVASASDSYSYEELSRSLRSSGGGGRGGGGRSSGRSSGRSYSYSRSSSYGSYATTHGGWSSSRYAGYTGTYYRGEDYFYYGYYSYRHTYVYAYYGDGKRLECWPEDRECIEDAKQRNRDTTILNVSIMTILCLFFLPSLCCFMPIQACGASLCGSICCCRRFRGRKIKSKQIDSEDKTSKAPIVVEHEQ